MDFTTIPWQLFGRAHFLVLHFPIALVMLVALLEFTRPLWDRRRRTDAHDGEHGHPPQPAPRSRLPLGILALATIAAALAAGSGWVHVDNEFVGDTATDLHRWFGVGAAAAALVALVAGLVAPRGAYLVILLIAAIGVGVTGHLGGELVHGEGFVLAPLQQAADPPPRAEAPAGASTEPPAPVEPALSFDADVYPILDAHCIRCHGPERQRGSLRLDSLADVEDAIIFGDADASLLIEVVELPQSDRRHMPKNEPSLPEADLATLRAWIDSL